MGVPWEPKGPRASQGSVMGLQGALGHPMGVQGSLKAPQGEPKGAKRSQTEPKHPKYIENSRSTALAAVMLLDADANLC
jgi:hypothetical protein